MANVDTPDDQVPGVIYADWETDDWAMKHQISLAEHASRLGSHHQYDNRGRHIWTDGFEETTLQWNLATVGGSTIARSTAAAWHGAASALFTLGMAGLSTAGMDKSFYNPLTGRYGLEVAWSSGDHDCVRMSMHVFSYDGAVSSYGAIGMNGKTAQYQYQSGAAAWTNVGQAVCQYDDDHFWHKMKLVVDIDNGMYVRALFDGVEHDLSAIPLITAASANCPRLMVLIMAEGDLLANYTFYFDDFILTHLEP